VDEDALNMSVRKFLKKLGVSAQREIELACESNLRRASLRGDETLEATATVVVAGDAPRCSDAQRRRGVVTRLGTPRRAR
jgi:hypothetical protein